METALTQDGEIVLLTMAIEKARNDLAAAVKRAEEAAAEAATLRAENEKLLTENEKLGETWANIAGGVEMARVTAIAYDLRQERAALLEERDRLRAALEKIAVIADEKKMPDPQGFGARTWMHDRLCEALSLARAVLNESGGGDGA